MRKYFSKVQALSHIMHVAPKHKRLWNIRSEKKTFLKYPQINVTGRKSFCSTHTYKHTIQQCQFPSEKRIMTSKRLRSTRWQELLLLKSYAYSPTGADMHVEERWKGKKNKGSWVSLIRQTCIWKCAQWKCTHLQKRGSSDGGGGCHSQDAQVHRNTETIQNYTKE